MHAALPGAVHCPALRLACAVLGGASHTIRFARRNAINDTPPMTERLFQAGYWKLVLPLALAAYAIANPIGDFPLNDDWAWSRDVQNVLAGEWSYTGWESMFLLPQILWGALVSKIFGFDHTVLRLSTIFLSLAGLWFLYETALVLTKDKAISTVCALLYLFNPIQFLLSNTFMTDVPFMALASSSVYFFVKRLRDEKDTDLWIAVFLCCLAALQRQFAVLIGINFAIALAYKEGLSRKSMAKIILACLLPGFTVFCYEFLLLLSDKSPFYYLIKKDELAALSNFGPEAVFTGLAARFLMMFCYCGLFFAPLIFSKRAVGMHILKSPCFHACLIAVAGAYVLLLPDARLPFHKNILTVNGAGPFLLRDVYILKQHDLPGIPPAIALASAGLAIIGGSGFLALLVLRVRDFATNGKRSAGQAVFIAGAALFLAYGAASSLFPEYYDRYALFNCAAAPLLILRGKNGSRLPFPRVSSLSWVIGLAVFSTVLAHDYLSWNRSKWAALDFLENEIHASPQSIDGGFEYNAMHFFIPGTMTREEKSWWWVIDDAYLVAFSPVPGYEILKEFPYARWLFPGDGRILALARQP